MMFDLGIVKVPRKRRREHNVAVVFRYVGRVHYWRLKPTDAWRPVFALAVDAGLECAERGPVR